MPFTFLSYLQPVHYFRLFKASGNSAFPRVKDLPPEIINQLQVDSGYTSEVARDYDLSWQAVQAGYIGNDNSYIVFEAVPIQDNYHFIRKQFHPAWVWYVLMIRLVSVFHPMREILAWRATRHIKRENYVLEPVVYPRWDTFNSNLLSQQPLVSVIIPTLHRYKYLKDVLDDLEKQEYTNFEVIVVDQSDPFLAEFYQNFDLNLHVLHQKEKALWLARNTAIKKSKGDYVLLFDDDSRIAADWISNHLKCLEFFNVDISSGVSISKVGAKVPENYAYLRVSDQVDTGNVLIKREVFRQVGLFDRQFEKQRMGDGEFGLRCYLHGILNISNPYAERLHLKVGTGGLREIGSWDAFRPSSIFAPRPIPSVLYYFRKYYGNRAAKFALLRTIPISILPYQFKKNKPMLILGVVLSVLLLPLVLFQVWRSWRLSSVKLREGARIERLIP